MSKVTSRRGTTAVDFAVISSVVLMLIFTPVDLGLMYVAQQALNDGVAQAIRYAVVNSTTSSSTSITSRFTTAVTPELGAATAGRCQVTVTFSPSNTVGSSVTVQASLTWHPIIDFDFMPSVSLTSVDSLVIQH
jgi:Flp pilus assembly protein TadG